MVQSPAQFSISVVHRVRVYAVVVDDLSLDTGFLVTLEFDSTMSKHIPEGEKRSGLYKHFLEQPLPPRAGIHTDMDTSSHRVHQS